MRGKALACAEYGLCTGIAKENYFYRGQLYAKRT
jgi:hypothetical protein